MTNKIKQIISSNIFFFVILTIIILLLYGKSINYELLVLDDRALITSSINFISDVKNIPKVLVTNCFYDENGYYRPILSLSFIIESILFYDNSKAYHTTNIILFILSIYLMYVFLSMLKLNKFILKILLLLLSVHPLLTSVSVWVAGRNDSLLAFFSMLTLICVLFYNSGKRKTLNFILAIFFFSLSLFTKESAMVTLLLIPIIFYSINKFNIRKIVNLYLGFCPAIIIFFVLRIVSGAHNNLLHNVNNFGSLLEKMIFGVILYVNKFFIPGDVPIILVDYVPDTFDLISAIIFFIICFVAYYKNVIDRKKIILGFSIFLLYSIPGFFGLDFLFHRLFIPSLGLIIIVVLFVEKIVEIYPISKKIFIVSFILLFFFFTKNAYFQADKYKNDKTLVLNGYKDAPTYHVFLGTIGSFYINAGDYDKALEFTRLAEKYSPGSWLDNIATILCYQNKFDEAEQILNKSIELGKNKEVSYANLSLIYEEKQDYKKSLEFAQKAYDENPYSIDIAVNLARKYFFNEKYKEAIDVYLKLLNLKENESGYYYSIAFLYDKLGEKEKSMEYIKKCMLLDNNNQKYKQFLSKLLDSQS